MKTLIAIAALVSAVVSVTLADGLADSNLPEDHILYGIEGPPSKVNKRATTTKGSDASCTNGPQTRSCWSKGFNVATDFDKKWPTTGKTQSTPSTNTKKYNFDITNSTCNPDGHGERICLLVNGQYPGPTVRANWGDYVSITVTNHLQNNGTGIHWHGIRQLNSNSQDGVGGMTECPLAPGQSTTYNWQATQFGTTWWHSHFSSQYGDGVFGPIIIDGPASANYDIDMGPVSINDFFYRTAFQQEALTTAQLQAANPGPAADNILINGKNKNANGGGSYSSFTFTPGKKHLLRLINPSVENAMRVSIDNHQMQVVTSDLVPIKPITVDSLMIGVGQRYNVIVNANQKVGNYWMRATYEAACASETQNNATAIISYAGAGSGNPTSTSSVTSNGCNPPGTLTPWVPNNVGNVTAFKQQAQDLDVDITKTGTTTNGKNIVLWGVNLTAMSVTWDKPTLSYVMEGNTTYPKTENVIAIPNEGIWTYWIIQETAGTQVAIPHPIHLHGHDFYVLGSGSGEFDLHTNPQNLQYTNPTRRDTTYLPGGGWLALAFPSDNPGAWLFHCHIAWHVAEGFGVQFLEAMNQIKLPGSDYTSQCNAWDSYQKNEIYQKDDSGV